MLAALASSLEASRAELGAQRVNNVPFAELDGSRELCFFHPGLSLGVVGLNNGLVEFMP